jgi:hypothetical protein
MALSETVGNDRKPGKTDEGNVDLLKGCFKGTVNGRKNKNRD